MYHDYCITGAYISFFVLTSGRPLPVTTFFVFSKPLCSHFAAQIVIREFSAPLQQRCLSLSKGFPLQRETAKICYCCSQPLYSSFVALLEVILQHCSFRTWSAPPGFQILRIDWEGMKDDALTHGSWCHLCKEYSLTLITTNLWCQKMPEKDVVGNVTSDLIALLPTNHIIAYIRIWHTKVYEKTFNVKSKIAQTMQNIWNFIVKKSTLQENGTSVIIWEISDSKFIWKLGDAVQNLESPGFPGRVDSTDTQVRPL